MLSLPEMRLAVHMLPVTKVQLERFLAEPNDYSDAWYDEVLRQNPRVSYRRFTDEDREGVFATCVLPEEAQRFATWMGEDFDLPTVEEWRSVYAALDAYPRSFAELPAAFPRHVGRQAAVILERLHLQLRSPTLLDLSLMRGGVIEWARKGGEWVGLGMPRPAFQKHLWGDPLLEEVQPIRVNERIPYFGFRLVRRR
jgi:hypothetical protein